MADRGVSQSMLARAVGSTQGAISLILLGKTTNSRLLPKIATYLGVSLGWLLGMEPGAVGNETTAAPWPRIMMEVVLPPERSLTVMFKALLAGIDRGLSEDEQARLLAVRLPIGLAQLQYARTAQETLAPETIDEDPAKPDRELTR